MSSRSALCGCLVFFLVGPLLECTPPEVPKSTTLAQLPGLSGTVPSMVGAVTQNFIAGLENRTIQTAPALRCVLLHGRPGTGKTVLAKAIAHATKSEFIVLKASGLVTSFQGSGAEAIQKTYDAVKRKLQSGVKSIVLFIDEIHALSSNNLSKDRDDKFAAHDHLLQHITENAQEHRLLMLFATSKKLDTIQETLLSRCTPIEIPHPSAEQRAAILQGHFNRCQQPRLALNELNDIAHRLQQKSSDKLLQKLSTSTHNDHNDRSQETPLSQQLSTPYTVLHDQLVNLDALVAQYGATGKTQDARSKLDAIIAELTQQFQAINPQDTFYTQQTQHDITNYHSIAVEYLQALKIFLAQKKHPCLSNAQLEYLAKETDSMPARNLVTLIDSIYAIAFVENQGIITEDIIRHQLKIAQESFALQVRSRKQEDEIELDKEAERQHRKLEREHRAKVRADYVQDAKRRKLILLIQARENAERAFNRFSMLHKKGLAEIVYAQMHIIDREIATLNH